MNRRKRPLARLPGLAVVFLAAATYQPAAALADPLTVNLTRRLTSVCDTFPVDLATCAPDHTAVRVSVTYDPDTLVFVQTRPDRAELTTVGPLSYTISLPTLDDPWGGPVTRQAEARAEFEGNPLGWREFHLQILDSDFLPGCTPDGKCDRLWLTEFGWVSFFNGPVVGPPTADDFRAMLGRAGGSGGSFTFMTVASYIPLGERERTFMPGSRFYHSAIPEPPLSVILPPALATTLVLWRRRRWIR